MRIVKGRIFNLHQMTSNFEGHGLSHQDPRCSVVRVR